MSENLVQLLDRKNRMKNLHLHNITYYFRESKKEKRVRTALIEKM